MKLDSYIFNYLTGEKLSTGIKVKIPITDNIEEDRISFLVNMVKDKRIIDLGCIDHLDIIESKIRNNTWLHKRLVESSQFCIGIDINREGVDYIRRLGYKNVYAGDILEDEEIRELILSQYWDLLVMGEVIEHIENPIFFLKKLREIYKEKIKYLILTTPNVFSLVHFKLAFLNNIEFINSDHKYYFSPYTLAKVMTISGFRVISFYLVNSHRPRRFYSKLLYRLRPILRDTLIVIGGF